MDILWILRTEIKKLWHRAKRRREIRVARKMTGDELYNFVRTIAVSYDCECAAEQYFEILRQLHPFDENNAHSLLRIAIRPIFYLGVKKGSIMHYVLGLNKHKESILLEWLEKHEGLITLVHNELAICCLLYELEYDKNKNSVILNHKITKEMADVFVEIPDREIFKEFQSFEDFKLFFYSLFQGYDVSQKELDRLILEEDYQNLYFNTLGA